MNLLFLSYGKNIGQKMIELEGFKMVVSKSKNRSSKLNFMIIDNIVYNTACKIQNGSIKIIKQDDIIIQININEKFDFNHQGVNEQHEKEVI